MKRLKRIFKWTLIIGGTLIAILLVANAIWVWRTGSRLEEQLAALREAGEPVSFADLVEDSVPPQQNAAILLRRAKSDIDAIGKELADVYNGDGYVDGTLKESELETIRSALQAYPNVVPLLQQAAACEKYERRTDTTAAPADWLSDLLPHISNCKTVARLLRVQALLQLADGQPDEALRTCILSLQLARHFQHEPMITGYLVSLACSGIAAETTNRVLRAGLLSNDSRQALESELALHDGLEGHKQALGTERVFGLESFRTMPARNFWIIMRPVYNDATSYYLDMIDHHQALAARPYPNLKPSDLQPAKSVGGSRVFPNFRTLADLVLPAILSARQSTERARARLRCLRVLNALQSQAETIDPQEPDLSKLGLPAEATTDPFTGKPLQVKRLPEGWLVYSVGKDLKDDGGDVDDDAKEAPDIGFAPRL
ncbi:MAG TPA: hypothetical protein VE890_11990 [Thermoguttaceae bacterium]|nr:hypothetical protein [Thermoguttaceae bacterium]